MKLANLETFVHLARLRHFGRTAKHLNTTQPAISSRLAALERELGVQLIDREGREFHLTPAGHEALRVIKKMLTDFDNLKLGFTDPESIPVTLRIGAIDAIVQTWLPRLYERLRQTYPGSQIEIVTDSTFSLNQHLKSGELDIAFCLDPVLEEGYRSFVVCSYAMAWVGSPKLVARDQLLFSRGTRSHAAHHVPTWLAAVSDDRALFPRRECSCFPVVDFNSLPTMIRLALDGFGVAAIPTIVVQRELASGELVQVQINKPFPPLTFIASYCPVPGSLSTEKVAELARRTATNFCAEANPSLAWSREAVNK